MLYIMLFAISPALVPKIRSYSEIPYIIRPPVCDSEPLMFRHLAEPSVVKANMLLPVNERFDSVYTAEWEELMLTVLPLTMLKLLLSIARGRTDSSPDINDSPAVTRVSLLLSILMSPITLIPLPPLPVLITFMSEFEMDKAALLRIAAAEE